MVILSVLSAAPLRGDAQETTTAVSPLSPGQVAAAIAGDVGSVDVGTLKKGLADPNPQTRAAAARAAFAMNASPLIGALITAVEEETDRSAAQEEFTALGALTRGAADEALFDAARRFAGSLDGTLAHALGRRGPDALALGPRLRDLPLSTAHWKPFFEGATRGGREALPAAADAALATGNPAIWAQLLDLAADADRSVGDTTLVMAIRSDSASVREATYWHLLRLRSRGQKPGPEVRQPLAESPEANGTSQEPVARLAYELLGRALGGRSREDRTALIERLTPDEQLRLPSDAAVLAELEGDERAAYGRARFGDRDAVKKRRKAAKQNRSAEKRAMRDTRVRTASDFPPGLVKDVLAVTGCSPGDGQWTGLEVRYDDKAALAGIGLFPMEELSPACRKAARSLLLMAYRPTDRAPRPNQLDVLALPLFDSFLSCVAEVDTPRAPSDPGQAQAGKVRLGGKIKPPRKVNHVPPVYPAAAKRQGRQGVVILQATIGTSGCVRSVEVLHGPSPDLDGAALHAVTFWRYTPTLLNGIPVPVIMTVTVNFRLR